VKNVLVCSGYHKKKKNTVDLVAYIIEMYHLTVLEAEKCKIKVPAYLVSGESSIPGR